MRSSLSLIRAVVVGAQESALASRSRCNLPVACLDAFNTIPSKASNHLSASVLNHLWINATNQQASTGDQSITRVPTWGWRSFSSQSGGSSGLGSDANDPGQQIKMSLGDALVKLVDAAVEMLQEGKAAEAVSLLKEGIAAFEPNFPDSPEIGELHNQVALLSLVSGDADGAASHAATALDITKKHFSNKGQLVGHRQLRLGAANFAQGRLSEAVSLLHSALETLEAAGDNSRHEAQFYLSLTILAGTRDVGKVSQMEERMVGDVKGMKAAFGAESMILSLALSQHDKIVLQAMGSAEPDPLLCEALLKQHLKLLEAVNPTSEDYAVTQYKLATFYYTHDMLADAHNMVRSAGNALRAVFPDDHDLVGLCKHRLGMVLAVQGDVRAAASLLKESAKRFGASEEAITASSSGSSSARQGTAAAVAGQGPGTGLAREALFGLSICKFKSLMNSSDDKARQEALTACRQRLDDLATAIGVQHMLSKGAMRHFAQLKVMAGM